MDTTFANKLKTLKQTRNLTVQELAEKAGVSGGLISGIIHGYRIIGEKTARKIANALNLQGEELEDFVHLALNNGCTEKVLKASRDYPSEIINLVAGELNALGISPNRIKQCVGKSQDANTVLHLDNGGRAVINVEVLIR